MSDNLLESIFPIGEERWVKLKYLDFEKVLKAFSIHTDKERDNELGYETMAIGFRDEYVPQVSALMDIKDEITNMILQLVNYDTNHYMLNNVRQLFDEKIKEISKKTIITEM